MINFCLNITYVCVDVDFWRSLAGQPDKLARIKLSDHHLSRLLDYPVSKFNDEAYRSLNFFVKQKYSNKSMLISEFYVWYQFAF